ncbi:MAG: RagB/SusD family nutrient uptake outer membrane protein [Bacteroides sp.]|nr:RagB/SusD family nutrient uptake outer membrane protein [Bacteroides sp.]MDY2973945.1 RagB/SusD family nutrient uptake outer membrane protein [Candidatus Cryptobacteroides sp.]MED9900012.1 RagB/SusD family nutrient uptake outer membrane protein [Bacteroidales bacterium]
MKKNIHIILMSAALMLTSCNDSFLDRIPHDALTDANYWQTETHLSSVANTFTSSLSGKDWLNKTEIMADSAPWSVTTAWRTIGGGYFTSDASQINSVWSAAYTGIGRTNYFLNNYQRATGVKEEVRERYAAEAYFYRAYNYWILTSLFGDVPLVTSELNVESPDVFRGRDARKDVIDRITKDLEDHYKALPEYVAAGSSDFGRVSQCAALALLSRIYLYNGRYEDAVSACERAMSSTYYKLYSTGHPDVDYVNLFNYTGRASRNPANKETLIAFVYNYDLGESSRTSHNLSRECWVPNDYARFTPTASMIECYLTKDGKIWDPNSATSYEDVFKDRDPRMTQSILAPGTKWEGGESGDMLSTDKTVFTYPKFDNSKDGCMSYTGYYMRKYVEPSTVKDVGHDDNDIVLIRYAEVLLNYAEAKEQLGTLTQSDIDKTINLLRDRVGMVHLKLSEIPAGSDIRTEIRRERRVELFFEGHRYFDIIRWKQGEILGEDLLGVRKDYLDPARLKEGIIGNLKWKTVNGKEYLVLESGRTFDPEKNYLLPVPFTQMQLNPQLAPNNPGWN